MVQEFYINHGSQLPYLRMEVFNNGRYDFAKFYEAIQDAVITFSMWSTETDILKISNTEAHLALSEDGGCEEKYILEYRWKERDTKIPGIYQGQFKINFNGNITKHDTTYPEKGLLIEPITEDLIIYVK